MFYSEFETALGEMRLIGDEQGIQQLNLKLDEEPFQPPADWQENATVFSGAIQQLQEYAKGQRRDFDVKLNLQGTAFQKQVWQALLTIPFGEVRSYKNMAETIGKPKAVRALGTANGKNPIPIIVPCHRVIGADGSLGGYSLGLPLKKRLLALEAS